MNFLLSRRCSWTNRHATGLAWNRRILLRSIHMPRTCSLQAGLGRILLQNVGIWYGNTSYLQTYLFISFKDYVIVLKFLVPHAIGIANISYSTIISCGPPPAFLERPRCDIALVPILSICQFRKHTAHAFEHLYVHTVRCRVDRRISKVCADSCRIHSTAATERTPGTTKASLWVVLRRL